MLHLIGHRSHLSYVFTSTKSSSAPERMQHGHSDTIGFSTLSKKKESAFYENVYQSKENPPIASLSADEKNFNVLPNEAYGSLYRQGMQQPADYEQVHIYDRAM